MSGILRLWTRRMAFQLQHNQQLRFVCPDDHERQLEFDRDVQPMERPVDRSRLLAADRPSDTGSMANGAEICSVSSGSALCASVRSHPTRFFAPRPFVNVILVAHVVYAIGQHGTFSLAVVVHAQRGRGPVCRIDWRVDAGEHAYVRLAAMDSAKTVRVFEAELHTETAQPLVVSNRLAHPFGTGMIEVRFFVCRPYEAMFRIECVPASEQELQRFQYHLDDMLITVHLSANPRVAVQVKYVHREKKRGPRRHSPTRSQISVVFGKISQTEMQRSSGIAFKRRRCVSVTVSPPIAKPQEKKKLGSRTFAFDAVFFFWCGSINMLFEIGDLIVQKNERGIVCNLDPPIMRAIDFHSYVPILHPITVVQSAYDIHASMNPEIVERVRKFLADSSDRPESHSKSTHGP